MKDLYKIHEIARLFRLHPDTLRYYEEKGLLHPVRGESGYRMYTIQDVCTLNVIRALRELDLPTEDIRAYLERRSVEETLSLLDRQEALLEEKLAALRAARLEAEQRRDRLERYRAVPEGQVSVTEEEARPYVFLRENVILEKEIDFLLKKLEGKHQDYIKVIGAQTMGAVLDGDRLRQGICSCFSCVFFLTPPGGPRDALLPAGRYAGLFYRGGYDRLDRHLETLFRGIRDLGLTPAAPPLELYRIDVHDTRHEAEYVTELQVLVKG
ncbi:MerR family transcriptional regulator [Oscillibacter sp. 1-3]|uniref:MerR family transcriptional regulator n=1 Tax=Oscillibacter sp. 1-3 TaxID=1235797 RepID=UPI0003369215|nr:MerR family transcriptional regulator [Oscillibacter sp. 1-3]EOS66503.1 hypothetical protein C816_01254 [Oscillibacter sp. 1-3]MCI9512325.1 MerR family transcriptional regulator [Oscillibacter sp.]